MLKAPDSPQIMAISPPALAKAGLHMAVSSHSADVNNKDRWFHTSNRSAFLRQDPVFHPVCLVLSSAEFCISEQCETSLVVRNSNGMLPRHDTAMKLLTWGSASKASSIAIRWISNVAEL